MINHINKDGARTVELKPCTNCGSLGHTAFTCPKKPRKPMQRSRMKPVGKVGKKLMDDNKAFLDAIPDGELYCTYCVYLGNEYLLDRSNADADHFLSRARHPGLRDDNSNRVVSCKAHNKQKRSIDGPEFLKILDKELEITNGAADSGWSSVD